MAFDAHKNLAVASIVTAPSPAASGTSLVVGAGQGARFPAVPFNCTIWPVDMAPDPTTAEVVRVTARTGDTLSGLLRAQEGTTARTVLAGDLIAATITAKSLTDIESGTNFPLITTGAGTFGGDVGVTGLITSTTPAAPNTLNVVSPGAAATSFAALNLSAGSNTGNSFYAFSENYATGGGNYPSSAHLYFSGANGLSISAATHRYYTAGVERGRIHASGGFSWGGTVDPGAGKLILSAGAATPGVDHLFMGPLGMQIGAATTAATANITFTSGAGYAGNITTTGTSTAYQTTSDARLKTSLGRHTDPDVLRRTVIHDFVWKHDGTPGRGVFAQEAVEVAPFAVGVGGDARDAGGNLTHPWGVDYSKYVPDLIAGWQQHDAVLAALSDQVGILRTELASAAMPRPTRLGQLYQRVCAAFAAWWTPQEITP